MQNATYIMKNQVSGRLINEYQVDVYVGGDGNKVLRYSIIGDNGFKMEIGVTLVDKDVGISSAMMEARFKMFLIQLGQLLAVELDDSREVNDGFQLQDSK